MIMELRYEVTRTLGIRPLRYQIKEVLYSEIKESSHFLRSSGTTRIPYPHLFTVLDCRMDEECV